MRKLAVIGAGAAGSMFVAALLRQHRPGSLAVTWLRGRQHAGRGVAYSTQVDEHLLNVRSAGIGLHADAPGEFLDTLRSGDRSIRGSDFLPRRVYGDYLQAGTQACVEDALQRGHRIELVDAEAVALRESAVGLHVQDDLGARHDVEDAVLAIGALPACPLAAVRRDAQESGRYLRNPWLTPEPVEAPRQVLIIGTGLTAVDAILSAAKRWPQAQLTAISRHGCLPCEHGEAPAAPYAQQAALHAALLESPSLRQWLRQIVDTIRHEPGLDWRAVIDGLRPVTTQLWSALDGAERSRFLRHVRWLWEASRHRMPPASARQIGDLRASGRLRVVAGHVHDVCGSAPLAVYWRARGRRRPERSEACLVIQATGLGTDVRNTDHALMRQLVGEGLVGADVLGLGIAADAGGQVLRPDGSPWPRVHAIGTLLRGKLWECSGLPEIRSSAQRLAASLGTTPPTRRHMQILGGQFAVAAP